MCGKKQKENSSHSNRLVIYEAKRKKKALNRLKRRRWFSIPLIFGLIFHWKKRKRITLLTGSLPNKKMACLSFFDSSNLIDFASYV
jgi:hypothetical protein